MTDVLLTDKQVEIIKLIIFKIPILIWIIRKIYFEVMYINKKEEEFDLKKVKRKIRREQKKNDKTRKES